MSRLAALAASGQSDNTLVVFNSDNGGLATAEGSPTCNAPWAEGKGWMYEGGTRVPWLKRWPGRIRPWSRCPVPIVSTDLYPTVLAAAGIPPRPQQHRDGVDLSPLFAGHALTRDAIYWHYPHYGNQGGTPGASIRSGDWKLIEFFEDNSRELYDLRRDPSETRDLAATHPDIADRLHARLRAWQQSVAARIPTERNPAWSEEDPTADPAHI